MLNRVVIMGRLVAEPELKTTGSGISVSSFSVAVAMPVLLPGKSTDGGAW